MSTVTVVPPKGGTFTPPPPSPPSSVGAGLSSSLFLSGMIGVIAMGLIIGVFAAKTRLGYLFGYVYYLALPVLVYLIAVGFNAISQQATCTGVTNLSACFMGALSTVGHLVIAMIAVNLIGPNGVFTPESLQPLPSQPAGKQRPPPPTELSDGILMVQSFFTTLRAPAMSIFVRDPSAAKLETVERKSPIYTGIGVGFCALLLTISGHITGSAVAQVC